MICDAGGQLGKALNSGVAAKQHIDSAPHCPLFAIGGENVVRRVIIDNDYGLHGWIGFAGMHRCSVVRTIDTWLHNH